MAGFICDMHMGHGSFHNGLGSHKPEQNGNGGSRVRVVLGLGCEVGRLRHSVTFALIRIVEIARIEIQEEYMYV